MLARATSLFLALSLLLVATPSLAPNTESAFDTEPDHVVAWLPIGDAVPGDFDSQPAEAPDTDESRDGRDGDENDESSREESPDSERSEQDERDLEESTKMIRPASPVDLLHAHARARDEASALRSSVRIADALAALPNGHTREEERPPEA